MNSRGLIFCSLLTSAFVLGCGDDDINGGGGEREGSICERESDCADGLACVPRGVEVGDPSFCGRGCERHDQCESDERCVAFCEPTEEGCTANPGYCSKVETRPWEPCGFAITTSCGDRTGGDPLTCITTESSGGSLGVCGQLCDLQTAGQCPTGEVCSPEVLASNTTGACGVPQSRGEACDPFGGSVCGSDDICASLTDPSGAGNCRQRCGGALTCTGATVCTEFAQVGTETLSACFPAASNDQDAGI